MQTYMHIETGQKVRAISIREAAEKLNCSKKQIVKQSNKI